MHRFIGGVGGWLIVRFMGGVGGILLGLWEGWVAYC